jgi:hypothetical protein
MELLLLGSLRMEGFTDEDRWRVDMTEVREGENEGSHFMEPAAERTAT